MSGAVGFARGSDGHRYEAVLRLSEVLSSCREPEELWFRELTYLNATASMPDQTASRAKVPSPLSISTGVVRERFQWDVASRPLRPLPCPAHLLDKSGQASRALTQLRLTPLVNDQPSDTVIRRQPAGFASPRPTQDVEPC